MKKTKQKIDNRGVSPVIGVILMVAITVIIAAVIGTFVLGFADNVDETAQAGVNIDEESDETTVRWISRGNSTTVEVLLNGTKVDTLDSVGSSTKLAVQEGESVSAVAKTAEQVETSGEGTVVKSKTAELTSSTYESSMTNPEDRIVTSDRENSQTSYDVQAIIYDVGTGSSSDIEYTVYESSNKNNSTKTGSVLMSYPGVLEEGQVVVIENTAGDYVIGEHTVGSGFQSYTSSQGDQVDVTETEQ